MELHRQLPEDSINQEPEGLEPIDTSQLTPEQLEMHNAFLNWETYLIKKPMEFERRRLGLPLVTEEHLKDKRETDLKAAVERQKHKPLT